MAVFSLVMQIIFHFSQLYFAAIVNGISTYGGVIWLASLLALVDSSPDLPLDRYVIIPFHLCPQYNSMLTNASLKRKSVA